jgi:hypothetical protein
MLRELVPEITEREAGLAIAACLFFFSSFFRCATSARPQRIP